MLSKLLGVLFDFARGGYFLRNNLLFFLPCKGNGGVVESDIALSNRPRRSQIVEVFEARERLSGIWRTYSKKRKSQTAFNAAHDDIMDIRNKIPALQSVGFQYTWTDFHLS